MPAWKAGGVARTISCDSWIDRSGDSAACRDVSRCVGCRTPEGAAGGVTGDLALCRGVSGDVGLLAHAGRVEAVAAAPVLVCEGRNLAGLDFAAAAPEDVGVA